MKYSIVVPHFNNYKGIKKLLLSIPYRNDIEIIIVDDNSDSEVFSNLQKLKFETQHNLSLYQNGSGSKGAGAARNIGIKKSSARYIIFSDSDDFFVDKAFDIIDKKIVISDSDVYYFKPTSQCLLTGELSDRHLSYCKLVDDFLNGANQDIRYVFYVPWSKVYFREYIIENIFEFDEVIASNDVMFSLKASTNAKISAFNDTIYCVTRGVGTLTVNFSKKVLRSRLSVSLRESKYIYENNLNLKKNSVISLVRKCRFKITYNDFYNIMKSYFNGHITFFPASYVEYLKKPKKLIKRLKAKGTSLQDKKYRN